MIFSQENIVDPFPSLAEQRENAPVSWHDDLKAWVVLDYRDISSALKNPSFSSNRVTEYLAKARGTDLESVYEILSLLMLQRDEPDHSRLRNLVHFAFKKAAVETYEARIREMAQELLSPARKSGEMDFVSDFAVPLPIMVISEIVGIPQEDRGKVKRLCDGFSVVALNFYAHITDEQLSYGRDCIEEFKSYLKHQADLRHQSSETDLLSYLVHAEEDGEKLSFDEIVANTLLLLNAGNETTTCLLANGLKSLLKQPEQLARMRQDESLIRLAVEELLRYENPVQFVGRICTEDMEFGGKNLKQGDLVLLVLASAGRDPLEFPEPDQLDISRHPNHHLAFSSGPHLCAGVQLARLEARIGFEEVIRTFSHIELASPDIQYGSNLNLRCPLALPIKTII
ncbi:MAG: cytochrome P450 [Proteobacteria bacterium]|nr:cytochrome P450 [Pseudomonadota bacterium]